MAAQLLDLNYDTRFARFAIDSKSDLNNLPKIDTAGKDNLNTINNVSQGSMAYCTDGKDYILSGSNEWIEYIIDGGGGGIDVLLENETNLINVTDITIQDCYKYVAFIVYIKEIETAVVVPSFTKKVRSNTISVNASSFNVVSSPVSTNQITLQSTKAILSLTDSTKGTASLYLKGSFAGCKGDKAVIATDGSTTFTSLSTLYLWRVYGILK